MARIGQEHAAELIGQSFGAEIDFRVKDDSATVLTVFTTRPDTLMGATYGGAPEHPLAMQQLVGSKVRAFIAECAQTHGCRMATMERPVLPLRQRSSTRLQVSCCRCGSLISY